MKNFSFKRFFLWVLVIILSIGAAGLLFIAVFLSVLSSQLPDVSNIDQLFLAQSTTIYDREGNVLYVKHGGENRKYVTYNEISPHVINATISMEDDQFWDHPGFDVFGIGKAALYELFGVGTKRGGSTITQQYVKYAFLTLERSYVRKMKELILAVRLEKEYDKKKIVELYLNQIPYGNNAFGVQKAAETYFAKKAKDLSLAESVVLAAIIQAPSHYNPYGSRRYSSVVDSDGLKNRNIEKEEDLHQDEIVRGLIGKGVNIGDNTVYVQGRSDLVLKRMADLGHITKDEKDAAWKELQTLEFEKYREPIKSPHLVFYVLSELEQKYGKEIVEKGGLDVYTTINPSLQEYAEQIIAEGVAANKERFNANNASLVSVDNHTGELLAMVGSADFYNEEIDGEVNVALSFRQPGSAFKPFIYAQAFYNRYSPASVIYDVPTNFGGTKKPKNFDGKFLGPLSIRQALGQSRNIPAIKSYFLAGEQKPIIKLTQAMGINYQRTDVEYGWPLGLGTAEVRLFDMVQGFSVFANNGKKRPIKIIKEIKNAQGDILEDAKNEEEVEPEEVLDPQIAYLVTNILADESVKLGPKLSLPERIVATKTGTSTKDHPTNKEIRIPSNLWVMGFTPDITTGIWGGNTNDTKSGNLNLTANGYDASAGIWQKFMIEAHKGKEVADFPRPQGIKAVKISAATGKLPGPRTPPDMIREELFASFSVPTEIDESYVTLKIDVLSNKIATAFCPEDLVEEKTFRNYQSIDPTRESWQKDIIAWAGGQEGGIPTKECDLHTAETARQKPSIVITDPGTYSTFAPGNIDFNVSVSAPLGVDRVEYYLDDEMVYTNKVAPYSGIIRLSKFEKDGARHIVIAKVYDQKGYVEQAVVEFKVDNSKDEEGEETPAAPSSDSPPENTP